jgi:ligand-binding sensor domain-containing protein
VSKKYVPDRRLFVSFIIFLIAVISFLNQAQSQTLRNVPFIRNFSKQMYTGGTQTWDICESENGLIFFANNDGLLVFDGYQFSKYNLPMRTIVRSLCYDSVTKRIYAGGQNEIGYFQLANRGSIKFHSLSGLMPNQFKGFEDVWSIKKHKGKIYFQTSRQVFSYDGMSIKPIKSSEVNLQSLYTINDNLLLTDESGSIFKLSEYAFVPQLLQSKLSISALLPYSANELLVVTYKSGIYKLANNVIKEITTDKTLTQSSNIYKASVYGNFLVLATSRNGIFILDKQGNIINNFNVKNGLQNNNVLSLYKDKNNNIWAGLDNGIDLIRLNYHFWSVLPDGILKGTGYSMAEFGNGYYFATNNGLYFQKKDSNILFDFEQVANTDGQVWHVQVINGKLFANHHDGLFEVDGLSAKRIIDAKGCWKIIKSVKYPGYYILGTYNGIVLLNWENGTLSFVSRLERFKESCRFLEEDDEGNIWIGHPYKGIYKLTLSTNLQGLEQVRLYGPKQGLPSAQENHVVRTDMGLNFCTSKGLYKYIRSTDRFEVVSNYHHIIDTTQALKRVFNGRNGKIWFVTTNEIGYLKPYYNGIEYTYQKEVLPKLDQSLVGGFEYINECSENHLFIGVESGFVSSDLSQINHFTFQPPIVMVSKIRSMNFADSVFDQYILSNSDRIELPERSVEFSFSSPNTYFYKELNFSSFLEGWDKEWSIWKPNNTREFGRLSYGNYTLHIKAKCMGVEGPATIVKFKIPAPWYLTVYAKFIYVFIGFILVLLIGFYPQLLVRKKASILIAQKDNHIKRQTEMLNEEKQRQEQERIELKNQKLILEIEHQGRELASSTMHIVQKSEKLIGLKDKLKKIASSTNELKIKPKISELIKEIESDTLIDKDWEKFELYFNNIHMSFTQSLKEKFPSLTSNDIKLCSYLRMNLSTKEIATILNISIRGVEVSRYRLRKKMGLHPGANLTDYLSGL